jgi:hypothetical protein
MSKDYGKSWLKIIEYDGTLFDLDFISRSVQTAHEIYLQILNKKNKTITCLVIV